MSQAETTSASGADDIAIWIHPSDPSQSLVIGAIKTSSTSLRTYTLAGEEVQRVAVPRINNVDLRYNFPLNGQRVALLAGSNRANDSIALFQINAQGQLQDVAARTISTGMDVYGCAMYLSVATGKYYAFVSSEAGDVQQWELVDNGAGKVDARMVRSFNVGSITEGIVADDVLGTLYVGEENHGIWRYSAEPNGGATRTIVDVVNSDRLDDDVEGLTIYYKPNGEGYLIASSQGNDDFAVYRREGANEYLGNFKLIAGNGVDAVADTDGIDVTNFPLGSQFPAGMFVAQDSDENFKLVRWDAIDAAFGELIASDGSWDPRRVGMPADPYEYLEQWKVDFGTSSRSDLTGDGVTDGADFLQWQRTVAPASAEATAEKVVTCTNGAMVVQAVAPADVLPLLTGAPAVRSPDDTTPSAAAKVRSSLAPALLRQRLGAGLVVHEADVNFRIDLKSNGDRSREPLLIEQIASLDVPSSTRREDAIFELKVAPLLVIDQANLSSDGGGEREYLHVGVGSLQRRLDDAFVLPESQGKS